MKSRLHPTTNEPRCATIHLMAVFIITLGLVGMTAFLLALPLLRLAKQALPIGASPAPSIHGREIHGALTDRRVEELIREEFYGQRLNVSRR